MKGREFLAEWPGKASFRGLLNKEQKEVREPAFQTKGTAGAKA